MKRTHLLLAVSLVASAGIVAAHDGNTDTGGGDTPTPNTHCWPDQNPHDYGFPLYLEYDLMMNAGSAGEAYVLDGNLDECTGNPRGQRLGSDGDYEYGVGGGFFPDGPWANNETCDYRLQAHHHTSVHFHDEFLTTDFHSLVGFVVGADPIPESIPSADPTDDDGVDCFTDGAITPGAVDPDDWLHPCVHVCSLPGPTQQNVFNGQPGGDGGYWVFAACDHRIDGELTVDPDAFPPVHFTPATGSTLACAVSGHIWFPSNI